VIGTHCHPADQPTFVMHPNSQIAYTLFSGIGMEEEERVRYIVPRKTKVIGRWYSDGSREVNTIPSAIWESLTHEQQDIMRFPIKN